MCGKNLPVQNLLDTSYLVMKFCDTISRQLVLMFNDFAFYLNHECTLKWTLLENTVTSAKVHTSIVMFFLRQKHEFVCHEIFKRFIVVIH